MHSLIFSDEDRRSKKRKRRRKKKRNGGFQRRAFIKTRSLGCLFLLCCEECSAVLCFAFFSWIYGSEMVCEGLIAVNYWFFFFFFASGGALLFTFQILNLFLFVHLSRGPRGTPPLTSNSANGQLTSKFLYSFASTFQIPFF